MLCTYIRKTRQFQTWTNHASISGEVLVGDSQPFSAAVMEIDSQSSPYTFTVVIIEAVNIQRYCLSYKIQYTE